MDENSKRTRVEPTFTWLRDHDGSEWPAQIIDLAEGVGTAIDPGPLRRLDYEEETRVPPSPRRLEWMIRNAALLAPRDGRKWREYARRVINNPLAGPGLEFLSRGARQGVDRLLILEGETLADCLIECEKAIIWIEGKRNDWLSPWTKWDVTRDQIARNTEAAWLYATDLGKEFCLLVCHEYQLKHHEALLINGYKISTWVGGWPHLTADKRHLLGSRIGTLTWGAIAAQWPQIGGLLRRTPTL